MINNVVLVGRLTKKPELRYINDNMAVYRGNIAITRSFKNKDGEYEADFPIVTAYGKNAEFIEKYFDKGQEIGITGSIRTGQYTNKSGDKVYTTEVIVDRISFIGSKSDNGNSGESAPAKAKATPSKPTANSSKAPEGFMPVPEDADDALPF